MLTKNSKWLYDVILSKVTQFKYRRLFEGMCSICRVVCHLESVTKQTFSVSPNLLFCLFIDNCIDVWFPCSCFVLFYFRLFYCLITFLFWYFIFVIIIFIAMLDGFLSSSVCFRVKDFGYSKIHIYSYNKNPVKTKMYNFFSL